MLFIQFRWKKEVHFEWQKLGGKWQRIQGCLILFYFFLIPDYHPHGFSSLCYHTTLLSAVIMTTILFFFPCDLLEFVLSLLWAEIKLNDTLTGLKFKGFLCVISRVFLCRAAAINQILFNNQPTILIVLSHFYEKCSYILITAFHVWIFSAFFTPLWQ